MCSFFLGVAEEDLDCLSEWDVFRTVFGVEGTVVAEGTGYWEGGMAWCLAMLVRGIHVPQMDFSQQGRRYGSCASRSQMEHFSREGIGPITLSLDVILVFGSGGYLDNSAID